MNCCLNKEELSYLLEKIVYKKQISNLRVDELFENAINYTVPLRALTYTLAKIVEEKICLGYEIEQILSAFYAFENKFYFQYDEISSSFVNYFITVLRDGDLTLEDDLNNLYDNFLDHEYERVIRY